VTAYSPELSHFLGSFKKPLLLTLFYFWGMLLSDPHLLQDSDPIFFVEVESGFNQNEQELPTLHHTNLNIKINCSTFTHVQVVSL
jgi:hypothetical protein